MKIAIIGSRGIPAQYGGFETLADRLSRHLAVYGHQVTVIGEQPDFKEGPVRSVQAWFSKRKHPVLFYLESVIRTLRGYDRVVLLGVGAGLFIWSYRLMRTPFITHVDGMEQLRMKFSTLQRWYVRASQRGTVVFSRRMIADADAVAAWWTEKRKVPASRISVIRYGTDLLPSDSGRDCPEGLADKGYWLVIARIVPENNIEMVMDGYTASGSLKPLVIIGNWNDSAYGRSLVLRRNRQLLLLDPVYDRGVVAAYRKSCFGYLHGHSVGGTNPTLVEALGAGCITVCHDNPFNRETTDGAGRFFKDTVTLANCLQELDALPERSVDAERSIARSIAARRYDWNEIGRQYEQLLQSAL